MSRPWAAALLFASLAAAVAAQEPVMQGEPTPAQAAGKAQELVEEPVVQVEPTPAQAAGKVQELMETRELGTTVLFGRAQVEAQRLQAKGDVEQAEQVLTSARSQCPGAQAGRPCRQILDYSLGYLLETSSTADAARQAVLLRAGKAYERVLDETPAHAPTLDNLISIYSRLGEPERAMPVLERALAADPGSADRFALQLGDLYLQAGNVEKARGLYQRAAEASQRDETPAQRLVQTYRIAPPADPKELIQLGAKLEERFPTAAREAYETAIRLLYRQDSWRAHDALVAWAGLLARSGSISVKDLASLPPDWDSAWVSDLRSYLENPEAGLEPHHWWGTRGEALEAVSQMALALGRQRLAEGDPKRAESVWLGAPIIRELRIELASLYSAHPELDPDGQKFLSTEVEIFDDKAEAYERSDLKIIQYFHTALGLLYVERGEWLPRGPARGAIFQLREALFTAEERWSEEGFYQPLPKVRERLADGYRITGEAGRAMLTYLDACRAYLDTDDLENANRILEAANELARSAGVELGPDRNLLFSVLKLRRTLAQAMTVAGPPSPELLQAVDSIPPPESADALPPPGGGLKARQRFKILADAALLAARDGGSSERSLHYAGAALQQVLGAGTPLVGAGDLLRLEKLQALVTGTLGVSAARPEVVSHLSAEGERGVVVPLALSAEAPTRVRVTSQAATAARIVADLGANAVLKAALRVRIDPGLVTVLDVAPGTDVRLLIDRMAVGPDRIRLASRQEAITGFSTGPGDITLPEVVSRVNPRYPTAAQMARSEGIVVVKMVVETDGRPGDVRVLRGLSKVLDEAAAEAVSQWRFRPARVEGNPVRAYHTVTVRFELRR